jgi:NTP pyrophosphatase (non-canonical NTP hydrolase)
VELTTASFDVISDAIVDWARERKIFRHSDSQTQLLKTMSELGELADALIKNDRARIIDGYGDVLVTLIIGSRLADVDLVTALHAAYREIKDRKGTTNANGVFIKNEIEDDEL